MIVNLWIDLHILLLLKYIAQLDPQILHAEWSEIWKELATKHISVSVDKDIEVFF